MLVRAAVLFLTLRLPATYVLYTALNRFRFVWVVWLPLRSESIPETGTFSNVCRAGAEART